MLADLHIHTTFSDGVYIPEQIVTQAQAAGMGCIAITDHDNIQAYDRAERLIHSRHLGLKLLRGVDISDAAIRQAVKEHNEMCDIFEEIDQLRKEENPRITATGRGSGSYCAGALHGRAYAPSEARSR